jgi:hypothetical protein
MGNEINRWGLKSSVEESFMSRNKDVSNISRRRFLEVAGSMAVAGRAAVAKDASSAPASPPPPTADYSVTVEVTNTNLKPIKYHTPSQNDASIIKNVAKNQTFTWAVKTLSSGNYRLTILFLNATPFVDAHGNPVYAFGGSESEGGQGKIGGKIAPTVPDGTYKYYVAIFDDTTGVTYTDDPKIIVGGGREDEAKRRIALALDDLKDAYAGLSGRPKVQKQIQSIEHDLDHVIDELK